MPSKKQLDAFLEELENWTSQEITHHNEHEDSTEVSVENYWKNAPITQKQYKKYTNYEMDVIKTIHGTCRDGELEGTITFELHDDLKLSMSNTEDGWISSIIRSNPIKNK